MNTKDSNVHAVVVTFNAAKWIDACLQSLLASSVQPVVWVVDNSSSDETCNTVRVTYPTVRLIQNDKNLGFGQANNLGIERALAEQADYILLLNQDAKLHVDCLEKLLQVARANPYYGILSPQQLSYKGTEIDPHCLGYLYGGAPSYISDLALRSAQSLYEIAFMPAAVWLLRSDSLRSAGLFDPLFHMYGEDFDLCQRMKRLGFKVGLVPEAAACHWHGGPSNPPLTVAIVARDQYWQYVVWLKDPSQPLVKTCLNILREFTARFLHKALYLDYRACLGLLCALAQTASRLGTIARNRKLCALPGAFLTVAEVPKQRTDNREGQSLHG